MPSVPLSSYRHRNVIPKLSKRPGLAILDEFMDPCNTGFAPPFKQRKSKFDIIVIHIHRYEGVQQPIRCSSYDRFELAMRPRNYSTATYTSAVQLEGWIAEEDRIGTTIFIEDLSLDMIDVLGSTYGIEPEFFANHLRGSETFRTGKWLPAVVRAPKILPPCIREAPFYAIEFRRPYHLSSGLEDVIDLRSRVTNIPRGAQVIKGTHTVKGAWDSDYFPDVFVYEKVSVYKKKDSKIGTFNCVTVIHNFATSFNAEDARLMFKDI
jgi:hypothetical protein